jgi:phosphinothricin acetyltransferase
MTTIRPATGADLTAVNDIYNHYVLHSTCTYQTDPETPAERSAWFAAHGPKHPVTVATEEDVVVAWASISPFHRRAAYANTVENSVYVHPDHHRKGLGKALMLDMMERAKAIGHHTIIAGIDAEQTASVALHRALGFVQVAYMKELGFKFGRWLDVIYMQKML